MTLIPEVHDELIDAIDRRAQPRRRRIGIALGVTVALAASGTAVAASGWNPLSEKLKAQPTVDFRHPGHQYDPKTVRGAGERLAAKIPVPPGHPIDVDWDASGGDNLAGMRAVAEYNASCQWYAYALEQTPSATTLATIADIPLWPSFRGTFKAKIAGQIADDLQAGKTQSTREQISRNCR
jgi:hypothetical protein